MQLVTDDDIHRLLMMEKAVRRDAHKMKAFVRFREVLQDGQPHFVAWHRPDHFVVRKVAPFFSRRFKAMNWTILTPDESVSWDQHELNYFEGSIAVRRLPAINWKISGEPIMRTSLTPRASS